MVQDMAHKILPLKEVTGQYSERQLFIEFHESVCIIYKAKITLS